MADTASCRNSECPENGVAKDTSMVPAAYQPLICGTCGQECQRDAPEESPAVTDT